MTALRYYQKVMTASRQHPLEETGLEISVLPLETVKPDYKELY